MRNWKVPGIILVLLILAMVFRWGVISSSTNNGTVIKTLTDRWNGAVWQQTIKNGSYSEKIVNPSWFESSRNPIDKQVEYQEPVYTEIEKPSKFLPNYKERVITSYVTKTKTIQEPPPPIYWLSSNGLTKIWGWLILINIICLLIAVGKSKKQEHNNSNPINT